MALKMKIRKGMAISICIIIAIAILLALPFTLLDAEKENIDDGVRAAVPGSFIRLTDGYVHYESTGQGTRGTVVLVHGFSAPYYVWDRNAEALASAGFRVIRYDLYGRGYSDRPDKEYDLTLLTRQLGELVDGLGAGGRAHFVALSFGASIVARFYLEHPEKVKSLVFVDPLVSKVDEGKLFPMNLPVTGELVMACVMAPFILPQSQAGDFREPEKFPDWETRYRVQMKYRGFKNAILSTIRHMGEIDTLSDLSRIGSSGCRVLFVWGEYDASVPKSEIDKALKAVPAAVFHAIPGAGHLSQYERPDVVNPIMIDFLSSG